MPSCLAMNEYKGGLEFESCILQINSADKLYSICKYNSTTHNITKCENIYDGKIGNYYDVQNITHTNKTTIAYASDPYNNVYIEQTNNNTNISLSYKYYSTDLYHFDDRIEYMFSVERIKSKKILYTSQTKCSYPLQLMIKS